MRKNSISKVKKYRFIFTSNAESIVGNGHKHSEKEWGNITGRSWALLPKNVSILIIYIHDCMPATPKYKAFQYINAVCVNENKLKKLDVK